MAADQASLDLDPPATSQVAISHRDSATQMKDYSFLYDESYSSIKDHFCMVGRGRRPSLPTFAAPTQRILAQLGLLKDTESKTWEELTCWFVKMFPGLSVTRGKMEYKCKMVLEKICQLEGDQLDCYLNTGISFDSESQMLLKLGLTGPVLLGKPELFDNLISIESLTNELVTEIEKFRAKQKQPMTFTSKWLFHLLHRHGFSVTESSVRHRVTQLLAEHKKKKLKKDNGDAIKGFLQTPLLQSFANKPDHCNGNTPSQQKNDDPFNKLVKQYEASMKKAHLEIERLKLEKICAEEERDALKVKLECRTKTINTTIQRKVNKATQVDMDKKIRVESEHLKRVINEQEHSIEMYKSDILKKEKTVSKLKREKRVEQQSKSKFKLQLEDTLMTAGVILEDPCACDKHAQEVSLKCKGNINNTFSDDVHLTYMRLQGEAGVPASQCSKVINIISTSLYGKEIKLIDLPSTQTALNIASEGAYLSKFQAVEEIRNSSHFTLGTDETSRQKRRYLERHIVLSNGGTLSLGFNEVANETADTLLEKSISLIEELCDVYCLKDEEAIRDSLFKEILVKMKCLMSDRAAVMKCFDAKMRDFKKEVLGSDCQTHFLFCNAHFLIGVANAAETALKEIEQDMDALGRDQSAKYSRFQTASETCALRLIRLASDVFGPRPDEKSGCRQEWLVFLESIGEKSKFSSFRSNRFNNIFENASAVVYHEDHIKKFLKDQVSHENMKLSSIVDDMKDASIMAMVAALSKFNTLFTSPYWMLINSSKSYGEFPPYVKLMEEFLTSKELVSPVFNEFSLSAVDSSKFESDATFNLTFRLICQKTLDVLKRQLCDFIGDGIYAGEIDENFKAILMTAPLSNLTGERLFGDLDYDIGKRRNASLHLRSALNMFKHNKTGAWLIRKKKNEAIDLLSVARKNRVKIRHRSRVEEMNVRRIVRERLEENERRRKEKELQSSQRHLEILNAILAHGRICETKEEIDHLLKSGPGSRTDILKAQIRYRKVILQEKDLSLTGDLAQLYKMLISHLGHDHKGGPPSKRPK